MVRQLVLAILLVAIVGIALFYGISGGLYIFLVFSAALLSVLFVRSRSAAGEERESETRRGRIATLKPFPSAPAAPPAAPFGVGRAHSSR
jgi:uncharacterized protein (DUF58 family)